MPFLKISVIFAFFLSSGTSAVAHLLLQFVCHVTWGCSRPWKVSKPSLLGLFTDQSMMENMLCFMLRSSAFSHLHGQKRCFVPLLCCATAVSLLAGLVFCLQSILQRSEIQKLCKRKPTLRTNQCAKLPVPENYREKPFFMTEVFCCIGRWRIVNDLLLRLFPCFPSPIIPA